MAKHGRFRYKSLEQLREEIKALHLEQDICFGTDLTPLRREVQVGPFRTPNALAIHPMEGHDATTDGAPSGLTFRRYERFARGGAGLIWFEATAIRPEWRAHPHQLCLTPQNVGTFARLLDHTLRTAREEWGDSGQPIAVLQLTHSGRYTRPEGNPNPIIAFHDPLLDPLIGLPPDYPVISDQELEEVEDAFADAACLAAEAGFNFIDVKSCHRYLCSEMLAAFTRPGQYGGDFDNRTRFLRNVVGKIQHRIGRGINIAVRLNAYDGIPYPYGWGVDRNDAGREDLTEPKQIVRLLVDLGVCLVNITLGNPYYNPHIGRPFDRPVARAFYPDEHPLEGVARFFRLTRQIQEAIPETPVVGTGYSWLRQFLGYAGTANLAQGWVSLVGVGREALAYPDFARDLLLAGKTDRQRVCITCSRCSALMIKGGPVGCAVFDGDIYGQGYKDREDLNGGHCVHHA